MILILEVINADRVANVRGTKYLFLLKYFVSETVRIGTKWDERKKKKSPATFVIVSCRLDNSWLVTGLVNLGKNSKGIVPRFMELAVKYFMAGEI